MIKARILLSAAALATTAMPAPAGAAGADRGVPALPAPLPPGLAPAPLAAPLGTEQVHSEQVGTYNWSGYALTGGSFHGVIDTWQVPKVDTALSGSQYSADWVGIGGWEEGTLVQAGTEADNLAGTASYSAWTEILPAAEDPLSLAIHPGDTITTSVEEISKNTWEMKVDDETTHQSQERTVPYSGSNHASAEAIHERPCIADGCESVEDLATLTDTTNVTFDPGKYSTKARKKPTKALLEPSRKQTLHQVFMVNNKGTAVIASPSLPDSELEGFAVAYGSTSPPPPSS
jgi:Peptidase A4 family